ncbi:MAG: prephenate dehydrogenase/arogenate dehydrogenase family protein, partial [Betaproteobacteria bacterium]|nr:prephenate dehydrogenase/arogenate dehydrogenase family protein [Betaproteobacteria bacterium]
MPGTASLPPRSLAVIGVGLIGGSFALALREAVGELRVVGYDRDEVNLAAARHLGVVDVAAHDIAAAVREADLVLVAVPVGQAGSVLEAVAPALSPTAIVTDVGSTKGSVVQAARAALGSAFERYVPGHPIAGAEHSGVRAARADLF